MGGTATGRGGGRWITAQEREMRVLGLFSVRSPPSPQGQSGAVWRGLPLTFGGHDGQPFVMLPRRGGVVVSDTPAPHPPVLRLQSSVSKIEPLVSMKRFAVSLRA